MNSRRKKNRKKKPKGKKNISKMTDINKIKMTEINKLKMTDRDKIKIKLHNKNIQIYICKELHKIKAHQILFHYKNSFMYKVK